jgi:dephospho-CoA kinase
MGKSTAAGLLAEMGAVIIDTDVIARQLVEPGQPALDAIRESFGSEVLAPDGSLDRSRMAHLAFSNPEARKRLESILHPRIRAAWESQVAHLRESGANMAVVVIPLLFETEAASSFDATLCVACSEASQWTRLRARGWTDEQIVSRIQAQWPIQRKMENAQFVTWAEGPISVHADQLRRILSYVQGERYL